MRKTWWLVPLFLLSLPIALSFAQLNNLSILDFLPASPCAGWTPSTPGNLVFWYKADAKTYNTGTTLATNGQTIATWGDNSGNAYDLTQATVANQPTWSNSPQSAVVFNNTTKQWMLNSFSNVSWGGSSPHFTVFAVINSDSVNWRGIVADSDSGGSSEATTTAISFFTGHTNNPTNGVGPFWDNNDSSSDQSITNGTTTRLAETFDGTTLTDYKNNANAVTHAWAVALTSPIWALTVGNNFFNDLGGTEMFSGKIYEVIGYKTNLSTQNLSCADSYLQRWT